MPKEPPQTIGDMRRNAIVTNEEITAAVEAYLAKPKGVIFEFGSGHILNLAAAVEAHRPAKAALNGRVISDAARRTIVRTAVILATPSSK